MFVETSAELPNGRKLRCLPNVFLLRKNICYQWCRGRLSHTNYEECRLSFRSARRAAYQYARGVKLRWSVRQFEVLFSGRSWNASQAFSHELCFLFGRAGFLPRLACLLDIALFDMTTRPYYQRFSDDLCGLSPSRAIVQLGAACRRA